MWFLFFHDVVGFEGFISFLNVQSAYQFECEVMVVTKKEKEKEKKCPFKFSVDLDKYSLQTPVNNIVKSFSAVTTTKMRRK